VDAFKEYHSLLNFAREGITLQWQQLPFSSFEHLIFNMNGNQIFY
jgi:hypothetical protein